MKTVKDNTKLVLSKMNNKWLGLSVLINKVKLVISYLLLNSINAFVNLNVYQF